MSADTVGHVAAGDWLSPALVYLGAAVLAVPLAKRLGFGAVLGYLLAGIAIGPWGLGLIGDAASVLHFAEFGVVLMLFLVGLELEPAKVWRLRRPIFVWGSLQMALCSTAIGGIAWWLGAGWQTALVLGFGLSLSSTAIALQALAERHQAQTTTGQTTVALSLAQDIQSIPLLALLPALAVGLVAGEDVAADGGGLLALKALAVVVAIVFGGRYLVRPLFRAIARSALDDFGMRKPSDAEWSAFAAHLEYVSLAAGAPALKAAVAAAEAALGAECRRLHYLSVPPSAALPVVRMLGEAGLVERSRIVMEKPFGTDLASAVTLNTRLHEVFSDRERLVFVDVIVDRSENVYPTLAPGRPLTDMLLRAPVAAEDL